jgi:glutamate/tyrosine decarboxylase-like PLP-dependent enzyme
MDSDITLDQLETRIDDTSLDLEPALMRRAGYQVVDWIVARLQNLRASPLGCELDREHTEALLREPLPEEGRPFDAVFAEYREKVAPNAFSLDHPRFFAFIPSAPNFVSILAEALVAGSNVFAGTWVESSGPSQVELVVMDWFKGMLGLPDKAAGLLVSGGSVASLTALAVARHAVLNDATHDARVYLSNQAHASIDRGLRILGISAAQIRRIPTEADLRMDTCELQREIQRDLEAGLRPFAVVANAGATNTGAIDPLASIAGIARAHSLWFHIDAAYGGFAALTERGRRSLAGIEQADSVALDPHKWLYCPFEAGCVLVRDGRLMRDTFRILPEYMADVARQEREVNFCDYGVQLTRSFRALKVWMALKTYGARRFRQIIDRCLDLAEYAARWFERSPRIELVTRPQLGIFTFRYIPERLPATDTQAYLNHLNEKLVAMITASRKLMLSSTRLGPKTVLRLCVLNHRARKEDIKEALSLIEQLGREAEASLIFPNRA